MPELTPPGRFKVVNAVEECSDGKHDVLMPEDAKIIALHRTIWEPQDAVKIRKRFQSYEEVDGKTGLAPYTGGQNPYHFMVLRDGSVTQTIELGERGHHARRWSRQAIAVALCHDAHFAPMPDPMGVALKEILRLLCLWVGGVRGCLYGHSELPQGSADPNKNCPGFPMGSLRDELTQELSPWWKLHGYEVQQLLLDANITL